MPLSKQQLKEAEEALNKKKKNQNGESNTPIETRSVTEDIDVLLGNGKRIKVFIGAGAEGADSEGVREFHFAPVPIGKLPELIKHVNRFQMMLTSGDESEMKLTSEDVTAAAKIAELSMERTDKVTAEQAKEWFSFSVITKLVHIAYSINEIEDQIGTIDPTTLLAARTRMRRQQEKMTASKKN